MCILKEATLTLTKQSNVRLADSTPIRFVFASHLTASLQQILYPSCTYPHREVSLSLWVTRASNTLDDFYTSIAVNIKIARCAQCRGGDSHQSAQPAFKIPDIWHVRYWGFQLAIKFALIAE